jgi:hypothetical protein
MGPDVDGLFQAFVNSPHHYENLVDPAFTRVGVGVAVANGMIFTAHEFMALRTTAPPARPAPAPAPAAAPARAGTRSAPARNLQPVAAAATHPAARAATPRPPAAAPAPPPPPPPPPPRLVSMLEQLRALDRQTGGSWPPPSSPAS